jgi:hypothetical protein
MGTRNNAGVKTPEWGVKGYKAGVESYKAGAEHWKRAMAPHTCGDEPSKSSKITGTKSGGCGSELKDTRATSTSGDTGNSSTTTFSESSWIPTSGEHQYPQTKPHTCTQDRGICKSGRNHLFCGATRFTIGNINYIGQPPKQTS